MRCHETSALFSSYLKVSNNSLNEKMQVTLFKIMTLDSLCKQKVEEDPFDDVIRLQMLFDVKLRRHVRRKAKREKRYLKGSAPAAFKKVQPFKSGVFSRIF